MLLQRGAWNKAIRNFEEKRLNASKTYNKASPERKIILPEININYTTFDSNSSEKVKEDLLNHRENFFNQNYFYILDPKSLQNETKLFVNLAQL